MNNIQLVVFDMAGTTVRDQREVENCFFQAAQLSGLQASRQRINDLQGIPKLEVVKILWDEAIGKEDEAYPKKVEDNYTLFKSILENHYKTHPVVPTEGALEAFDFLRKRNIKIALTTGFYRKVCNIILTKLGWDKGLDENYQGGAASIIDLSLTPDETGKGRPHPDMIFKAMKIFNITDPKQVVKIGDTPSDLKAGKVAQCLFSLGVTNGTHTREELLPYDNDGLLDSMQALPEFLLKEVEYLH